MDGSAASQQIVALHDQIGDVVHMQKQQQGFLMQHHQPTSVLGVPVWKLASVAGVATTAYLKVYGYEMRDLVYVSKKHFNSITDSMRVQIESLEEVCGAIKVQLLERIGVVEEKVDDAKRDIEAKIGDESAKLRVEIGDVGGQVSEISGAVANNSEKVDKLAEDVAGARKHLESIHKDVGLSLSHLRNDLDEVQRTTVTGNRVMRGDIQSVHSKVDNLDENTRREFHGFNTNMTKVTKGLGLLCEFVFSQANEGKPSQSLLSELQQFSSAGRVTDSTPEDESSQPPQSRQVASLRKRPSTGLRLVRAISAK
jgi:predicted  nucleic acid-binding Zn-ribbon protein